MSHFDQKKWLRQLSFAGVREVHTTDEPCFAAMSILQINALLKRRIKLLQIKKDIFKRMFSDSYYVVAGGNHGIRLVSVEYLLQFSLVIPPSSTLRGVLSDLSDCSLTTYTQAEQFDRYLEETIERHWNAFLRYVNYVEHLEELSLVDRNILEHIYLKTKNMCEQACLKYKLEPSDLTERLQEEQKRALKAVRKVLFAREIKV
jgi:hypothetical protein